MNKTPTQSEYAQRIRELKDARREVFGMGQNIEKIWRQADHDYIPHTIQRGGKKILEARDDSLGWASRFVNVGSDNWQTDNASVNPYIKIQTALSIMISRNPGVELSPGAKKYEKSTLLQKELYKKSWEIAKSLQQLKLFAFNLCKYGWGAGRTYPYQDKEFNGIYREALDPWLTWIDDKTKPNEIRTTRDWTFAKWMPYKTLEKQFEGNKNLKFIQKGQSAPEDQENDNHSKKFVTKDMKLVHFYENLDDDVFSVLVDDIPIIEDNLPLEDNSGKKYLSLWHTYWTLRHANSPMGIGINEAIRNDRNLFDKMRNMTIDQIILSIYKMFFYSGTDQLDADGVMTVKPGVGRQVADPQNLKWLEAPGPGKDSYNGIEMMQNAIDEASGITKPLTGQEIGKTAYEAAQASEFSLRRLQTPLGNITDALEQDAALTIVINKMIYSTPEIIKIVDQDLIQAYFEEIQADPALYERDEEGNFYAKLYPEVQMNLDTDEGGRLIEAEDSRFFRVHPNGLNWEGTITVKGQSILVETKVLQKAQTLEVFNIITPLLAQQKEIVLKPIKQLLKKYDLDWKDWVPDQWMLEQPDMMGDLQSQLFVPQGSEQAKTMQNKSVVPRNETKPSNKNLITQTQGQLASPGMAAGR